MKLSNFDPLGNTGSLIAGEALAARDLVYVSGIDGKGYKVASSDYARIGAMAYGTAQTSEATGRLFAEITLVTSIGTEYHARPAIVRDASTGFIYTLADYGAGAGMSLRWSDVSGAVLASVDIQTATQRYTPVIRQLANGNIACLYMFSTTSLHYAVYDSTLNVVVATTEISTISTSSYYYDACVLSAGGFAVVFHDGGTVLNNNFITFSNAGVVVQAETTIFTRTGTNGAQYHQIRQLSDGNLAVVINSRNTVSSIGLYYGVITTAGVIVKAFTNLDAQASLSYPGLAVMSGYFVVAGASGSNQIASVFNNVGTLQGTGFTEATIAGNTNTYTKVMSDGTDFWLIWHKSTGTFVYLTKLPITGTNYVTTNIEITTSQYGQPMDAFIEGGLLVSTTVGSGNVSPKLIVVDLTTQRLVSLSTTFFGVAPGTSPGTYIAIIPSGDRSFTAMYTYTSAAATNICAGKYANTALIGVAQVAAAAGATVRLYVAAGAYETTTNIGGVSAAIDHSANTLVGQRGTVLPRSAILKGIGV